MPDKDDDNLQSNSSLSTDRIAALEESLLANPEDIPARTELLDHYLMESFHSKEARIIRNRHILWVIEHHPEIEIAGSHLCRMHFNSGKDAIRNAKRLWKKQATGFPKSAAVLGNAASFLSGGDATVAERKLAQTWLQTAESLDPTNPEWPKRAGFLAYLNQIGLVGLEKKTVAQQALQHFERSYARTVAPKNRVVLLQDMAKSAVIAEEFTQAKEYAEKLLEGASHVKGGVQSWIYGNALHWGHIVLGELALQSGDRHSAVHHLSEAGTTPGSPQLDSFGPDIRLARRLLELGETEATLAYFKACSRFWECGKSRLAAWISAIELGRVPDFDSRRA